MNLVTLLNEEQVTLASGKLVYGAEETGALRSAIASAESLAAVCRAADERIAKAAEEGSKRGYDEGFEAGMQEGRKQISAELVRLAEQSQLYLEEQRNSTTELALEIVRKVAGSFAPDKTLSALAAVAAQECAGDESVTLRIHPEHSEAVKQRLQSGATGGNNPVIASIVADASLDEQACVLETRHGSVIADLETQLLAILNSLPGN